MDMIVLAYHDCLKGNLKKMLLSLYRNLYLNLIKIFLWIEQLIRMYAILLRDLSFAIKVRCVIFKYSPCSNLFKFTAEPKADHTN